MKYRIEAYDRRDGFWDSHLVGDDESNTFDTEQQAEQEIAILRTLGLDWEMGQYRVVEIVEDGDVDGVTNVPGFGSIVL